MDGRAGPDVSGPALPFTAIADALHFYNNSLDWMGIISNSPSNSTYMKKLACFAMVCALVGLHCAQAQPAATNESSSQLTVELRDGSRVVGKSLEDTFRFHSAVLGDRKLFWAGIRSIDYADANAGVARLTTANGDGLTIQAAGEPLRVETVFGQAELPVKLIRNIRVSAAGNAGQWSSGLVARWTGDGNAKDSAGHFDGQVSGGVSYVPGPAGQAFQFNGGASKVDFGPNVGNFGTNDYTIAYWMKTGSRTPVEALLAKRAVCNGYSSFWEVLVGTGTVQQTGILNWQVQDAAHSTPYGLLSTRPLNDGQWHHIAWVRQTTGSGSVACLLYLDGALDNSKTYPDGVDLASQSPLVLGQNVCQCCDGTRPYSGAAADLQIFSQALSVEEIITIYQAGNPRR